MDVGTGGGPCTPPSSVAIGGGEQHNPGKKQAVFERLRRRMEGYRRHQSNCIPRFEQSFSGIVDHNLQDTLLLKQRFLENKPKRSVKKSDKKPTSENNSSLQSSLALPKFPKCNPPEENPDNFTDSSVKSQQKTTENMTKFSVEIVQQLEFTATSTNSQISANITVKALNTSVKGGGTSEGTESVGGTAAPRVRNSQGLVECKQEPENSDFVDLEQCAAALEKDANGGNSFPGLSDLIGDDTSDAISSEAFKDLLSEISEYSPELMMKEFDFNHSHCVEKSRELTAKQLVPSGGLGGGLQPHPQQQQQQLSPAAQTLKNMAEQHQTKAAAGLTAFSRLKPYPDFNPGGYSGSSSSAAEFQAATGAGGGFKVTTASAAPPPAGAGSQLFSTESIKQETFSAQNSPVGSYGNSPSSNPGKTPSPVRLGTSSYSQLYHQHQQQYRQQQQQQQMKLLDFSKQPTAAGGLQPTVVQQQQQMFPLQPMLRVAATSQQQQQAQSTLQYLPRYQLAMPRAGYPKAARQHQSVEQPAVSWLLQQRQQHQQPTSDYLHQQHQQQQQEAVVAHQLRLQQQQQFQMNQVRLQQHHQQSRSLSASSAGPGMIPFSSSTYTSSNASFTQTNFINLHHQQMTYSSSSSSSHHQQPSSHQQQHHQQLSISSSDFNLDFLEGLHPTGAVSAPTTADVPASSCNFSDQELLFSSLESPGAHHNFTFQDIL